MHNVSMHNPIPFCLIFFIYTYRSPTLSLLMDPCFPLPFPHLSLCEWVTDIAVPLTSLSTDLQGIRSPSDLPVITVTPEPIPIIAAGHVNSQLNQKVSIPKETYWNIESVGPCVSDLLQLGIGSFVVLADCPLNHSWPSTTNLAPGETQSITKGCVQADHRVKFKFKHCFVVT